MKIGFGLIVSSPLKRSLQTATLVTESGYKSRVLQSDSLAPEATLKDFKKLLNHYRDRDSVLVMGHNPSLTVFVGALIASANPARIRLRKGSLAKLSFTQSATTLQYVLESRIVRTLYAVSVKAAASKSRRVTTNRRVFVPKSEMNRLIRTGMRIQRERSIFCV